MTIDEAIIHAEKVMVDNLEKTKNRNSADPVAIQCFLCADEHRQLAEWLKELKQLREQVSSSENPNRWIPVSERYPEDGQHILFSTKTGCVFEGKYSADTSAHNWLSYKDDTYAWNNVVTAWMPLPKPYKASPTGAESEA